MEEQGSELPVGGLMAQLASHSPDWESFFLSFFLFFFVPTVTGVGGDILALKVRGQQHDWREEELWVGVCCTDQMFSLMSVLNFYRKRGQCQLLCSQLSSIGDGTVSIPVLYCLASLFSAGVYVYRH